MDKQSAWRKQASALHGWGGSKDMPHKEKARLTTAQLLVDMDNILKRTRPGKGLFVLELLVLKLGQS